MECTTCTTVSLWYQREKAGDFTVAIRYDGEGYKVRVVDEDERDPVYNEHMFTDVKHLIEYLCMLHQVVLNDHDTDHFYTHFQYAIPFFPSAIVPMSYLRNHVDHYEGFLRATELFFRC